MAKEVQLKKNGGDVYPRTLDRSVLVSGSTLLSEKLDDLNDGTWITGKAYSAVTSTQSTYSNDAVKSTKSTWSGLADKSYESVADDKGNNIYETYVQKADITLITENEINNLF